MKGWILKIQGITLLNKRQNSFRSISYDCTTSEDYYSENPIKIKDVAITGLVVASICYALSPLIEKKEYILKLKDKLFKFVNKNASFDKTV